MFRAEDATGSGGMEAAPGEATLGLGDRLPQGT
jgi:hypothetical protein